MNEMFKTVLSLSVSGTLLAVPILLFCLALKDRASKAWQYYIWLIVVARMLLPFTPAESLVGTLFRAVPEAAASSDGTDWLPGNSGSPLPAALPDAQLPEPNVPEIKTAPVEVLPEEPEPLPAPGNWLGDLAWSIWILGAVVFSFRKTVLYQSFYQFVKAGRQEISDPALLDLLSELCESEHIRRRIELYSNRMVASPMLIGVLRPFIVLPGTTYSEAEFRDIIRHELIHYKRRDLLYKWLVQCVVCLHWFNPVVYLVSRMVNKNCELSCDEALLKRLDREGRKQYGNTLLAAIRIGGKHQTPDLSVTLNEDGKLLKERLEAIMKFCKKSKWATALMAVLTAAACMGAAVTGAYAAAKEGGPYNTATPEDTAAAALDALKSQDMAEFDRLSDNYLLREELQKNNRSGGQWSYLCNHFNRSVSKGREEGYSFFSGKTTLTGEDKQEADEILSKLSYQIGKTALSGNTASVEVTITNRDFSDVIGIMTAASLQDTFSSDQLFPNIPDNVEITDDLLTLLKNTDSNSQISFQVKIPLKKVGGSWKLVIKDDFTNAIFGNLFDGADDYLEDMEASIDEQAEQWAQDWEEEWRETYSEGIAQWTENLTEDIVASVIESAFWWK